MKHLIDGIVHVANPDEAYDAIQVSSGGISLHIKISEGIDIDELIEQLHHARITLSGKMIFVSIKCEDRNG